MKKLKISGVFLVSVLSIIMICSTYTISTFAANQKQTISTIKLSDEKLSYTGKNQKPKVTVKNSEGKRLVNGTDYTVTYPESSKNIGTYKLTVKFTGEYSGKKTLTYHILPQIVEDLVFEQGQKHTRINGSPEGISFALSDWEEYRQKGYFHVSEEIDGVTLNWSKSKGATKYRVYIYKNNEWIKLGNTKDTTYTVKDLKPGKRYTFAVRAFTDINGERFFSETYTKIITAPRPDMTPLTVKIKNNKAYLSWERRTCDGYYIYLKANDEKTKRIDIKDREILQYVWEYPDYTYETVLTVKAYTNTDCGKVFSDINKKHCDVIPTATQTSDGIKIGPVTSAEAKKILNEHYYWTVQSGDERRLFEGKSADGKRVVIYHYNGDGEWSGMDSRGVYYYGNGKVKRCPQCNKLAAKNDGKNMCDALGCYIFFGYSGESS